MNSQTLRFTLLHLFSTCRSVRHEKANGDLSKIYHQFNRQLLISGLARTGRKNSDNREFSEDDGSWVGLGSCTIFGTKLVSTDLGEI